jgi:thioredoxin-related protein
MKIKILFLIILFLSFYGIDAKNINFIENDHYVRSKTINSQPNIEVHYFFSFQCPACAKISKKMHEYLEHIEVKYKVSRHPLVMNQTTMQLNRAYFALDSDRNNPGILDAFYDLARLKELTDEHLISTMQKKGDKIFPKRWENFSQEKASYIAKSTAELAKQYQINFIPICFIAGPNGVFMVYPSKNLPAQEMAACIDYVILLQTPV